MQDRPPTFVCRNELEGLMASPDPNDWIKISTMLLGPVPDSFVFEAKHKSNSYATIDRSSGANYDRDVMING
jgi:tRNA-dihydrouridine synthase 3